LQDIEYITIDKPFSLLDKRMDERDYWDLLDNEKIQEDYSKKWFDFFIETLSNKYDFAPPVKNKKFCLYFDRLNSPQFYNYGTDTIVTSITRRNAEKIIKYMDDYHFDGSCYISESDHAFKLTDTTEDRIQKIFSFLVEEVIKSNDYIHDLDDYFREEISELNGFGKYNTWFSKLYDGNNKSITILELLARLYNKHYIIKDNMEVDRDDLYESVANKFSDPSVEKKNPEIINVNNFDFTLVVLNKHNVLYTGDSEIGERIQNGFNYTDENHYNLPHDKKMIVALIKIVFSEKDNSIYADMGEDIIRSIVSNTEHTNMFYNMVYNQTKLLKNSDLKNAEPEDGFRIYLSGLDIEGFSYKEDFKIHFDRKEKTFVLKINNHDITLSSKSSIEMLQGNEVRDLTDSEKYPEYFV
jgi:hypothetical protein